MTIIAEFLGGPRCGDLEEVDDKVQALKMRAPGDGVMLTGVYLRSNPDGTGKRFMFEWQGWR